MQINLLMLRSIAIIYFWIVLISGIPSENVVRGVFGVQVGVQANSQMTTFVCYINNGRSITYKKYISQNDFVKYASGYWPSIYNPERINYFDLYKIDAGVIVDSVSRQVTTYCSPCDSLWKIRHSTYPFQGRYTEYGWSPNLYKPSSQQEIFLFNNYGIKSIDEPFLDSNFWKLLSDVQDPGWIKKYKTLR